MAAIHVERERVIDAKPEVVYRLLSDYRSAHARILPPNYSDYGVDEGGQGAGTVFHYRLRAGGRERAYRIRVTEPESGSSLLESDTGSSLVTAWTLSPVDDGARTRVRLSTDWQGGSGMRGFMEQTFAPLGMKRIYSQTLERLASVAAKA